MKRRNIFSNFKQKQLFLQSLFLLQLKRPMLATQFEVVVSIEKEDLEVTGSMTESTVDDDKIGFLKSFIDTITFTVFKWSTIISFAQTIFMFVLILKFGIAPEEENPFLVSSVCIDDVHYSKNRCYSLLRHQLYFVRDQASKS
jgi:hypothetical protein